MNCIDILTHNTRSITLLKHLVDLTRLKVYGRSKYERWSSSATLQVIQICYIYFFLIWAIRPGLQHMHHWWKNIPLVRKFMTSVFFDKDDFLLLLLYCVVIRYRQQKHGVVVVVDISLVFMFVVVRQSSFCSAIVRRRCHDIDAAAHPASPARDAHAHHTGLRIE